MGKFKRNTKKRVKKFIKDLEGVNKRWMAGITNVQKNLGGCSEELGQTIEDYIRSIKDNIRERQKIIDEIKGMDVFEHPKRMIDITYEIHEIDLNDIKAKDICNSIIKDKSLMKTQ
jgi:hypothetical protein